MHRITCLIAPLQCSYFLLYQWILAFFSDVASHSLVPRVARQGLCPVLRDVILVLRQFFLTAYLSRLLWLYSELCASSCCPPTAACFPYLCFLPPSSLNVSSALLNTISALCCPAIERIWVVEEVELLSCKFSWRPSSPLSSFWASLLTDISLYFWLE